MRSLIIVGLICLLIQPGLGQKLWDGGASTDQWTDANNWYPDGIPLSTDQVLLNNQFISGDYLVSLPMGNISTQILSFIINPTHAKITVILPNGNTAVPGLQLNALDTGLVIREGGIFKNVSGAGSGNSIQLAGKMVIYDGGRYIHQTARSNATISDKLVFPIGTNKGIFEFDVPGTAGYTISITGKTFGNLYFKASAAGGNKSYSGSGSSNLTIKGDLWIDSGANVTSTMTADLLISGDLIVDGKLSMHPSTSGTTLRRMVFDGTSIQIGGKGIIATNSNFRNLEIAKSCSAQLMRNLQLLNTTNSFINYGRLQMDSFYLYGPGKFIQMDSGFLLLGDLNGINSTNYSGNIRTETKFFSKQASYIYNGQMLQETGDALPDTINVLCISNPSGINLSKNTHVADSFFLNKGVLKTDSSKFISFFSNKLYSPFNQWQRQNSGWERSYIQGPFSTLIPSNSSFELPSGSEWGYEPIILKNQSTISQRYQVMHLSSVNNASQVEHPILAMHQRGSWSIKSNAAEYQIAIPLSATEIYDIPHGTTLSVGIYNENSQSWKSGKSMITSNPDLILLDSMLTGDQNISLGYMNSEIILPLGINDFQGKKESNLVKLSWNTLGTVGNKKFIIQESSDGKIFRDIGNVELIAQDNAAKRLVWNGKTNILSEFGYYRIKYESGNFIGFSQIIKIRLLEQVVHLYPNPVSSIFFLKFQKPCNEYLLEIVNIYGLVVQNQKFSGYEVPVSTNRLQPGIYWLRISSENFSKTLNLTKY